MSVNPTFRAALTRQFYLVYLNSPDWRARRNQKLREVKYRCERCSGKRELEVHHLTYDNFGHEPMSDLQALCAHCYRAERLEHSDQMNVGVYLKLASDTVRANPWSSIADLSETLKLRCVELKIPVIPERVQTALNVVCGNRLRTSAPRTVQGVDPACGQPLARDDAPSVWCRLKVRMGKSLVLRRMPGGEMTQEQQKAHEARLLEQAAIARRSGPVRSRRRPVMDRLKHIFEDADAET